uniref:Preprotein translocase subunit SecY n=1 Tax=Mallomonas splendens TaxID=52552 RepID=A0A3G2QZK8_9STRA|nr:preprotein translocase subunit SecY [Mallomonas splendens]AYO28566.1 preprotein translocase subunit SecY [Mallomonas splendens]
MFSLLSKKNQNTPTTKIFITLFILFVYRLCNSIPLSGIDQEALANTYLQFETPSNSIMQIINMYSGSGGITLLSPFSLGIIPFINASIFIDLLTASVPSLEKLQTEEGELGRQKINFYKKILTLIFAIIQVIFTIFYIKSYIYDTSLFNFSFLTLQLSCGSLILVWLSSLIDNKGIGNGTSLIILANIVISFLNKNFFLLLKENNQSENLPFEFFLFFSVILLICICQTARIKIDVVSARQLVFLENEDNKGFVEKYLKNFQIKETGLTVRLNQAGIFPIIIASNIAPFLSYFSQVSFPKSFSTLLTNFLYYISVIGFNYFYTIVFWDPEKISEQLRKASVSVLNVTPGQETINYLEKVVRSSSILGGIFLCFILFFFDYLKQFLNGVFLNQINISSLIILVGVCYEIQRIIRSFFKNTIQTTI